MGVFKEFKEFALKGSVLDLAVGIIIGAAFGAVVKSLVDDIIMPAVGVLLGGVDFSNRYFVLKQGSAALAGNETVQQARNAGAVVMSYGLFINAIITFLIVAFAVFLLVKAVNRARRPKNVAPGAPTTKNCTFCTESIPVKATRCPRCTSQLPSGSSSGPSDDRPATEA